MVAHRRCISHPYVVRLGDDRAMGFGDAFDEAIVYATDARAGGRAAEVWTTDNERGMQRRIWPNAHTG